MDAKKLVGAMDKVKVPQSSPKQGVKIVTDEKAMTLNSSSMDDDSQIEDQETASELQNESCDV